MNDIIRRLEELSETWVVKMKIVAGYYLVAIYPIGHKSIRYEHTGDSLEEVIQKAWDSVEAREVFKCRCCGMKYDHEIMASDDDVAICKWCANEVEDE